MPVKEKTNKKTLRLSIESQLQEVFQDFEKDLGQRKFQRNIRKASKAMMRRLKIKSSSTLKSTSKTTRSVKPVQEAIAAQ